MYQPLPHRQEQLEAQHALIRSHPLGLLISHGAEGLQANSIPFLIDPKASRLGTLQAHMARANGQWRALDAASDVLVIFQGADHYITPSWYETKRETGKVVPTWNYVAIHAYGPLELFDDAEPLLEVVTRLTNRHEGARAAPWAVDDAPADFIRAQLKGIIGFRLPIVRLEGKWKLCQNRPPADRAGVVEGLSADGRDDVAALVPQG